MLLLKVGAFLVPLLGVHGVNFALTALIHKISDENGLTVVYVVGRSDEFFGEVLSKDLAIPIMVLRDPSWEIGGEFQLQKDGVLVIEALRKDQTAMRNLEQLIPRLRLRKFVVVVATSTSDLLESFTFFAEHKFTRIFGVAGNVYHAYLPYANSQLQAFSLRDVLPDARRNLNGHTLRITSYNDLPRVYGYAASDGRLVLTGYAGEMFRAFLRRHNATYAEVRLKNLDKDFMAAQVNATISNEIDFGVNPYADMDGVQMSYPIHLLQWGIMVPIVDHLNPTQYFVRPFTPALWLCIGLTLAFIVTMDVLKDRLTQIPVDPWTAASRTMLMMLAKSTERPIREAYRFHLQVLLFGFILGNLYLALLQSFLTVFIKVPQYETIQDMIDNRIPLMMVNYEWDSDYFPELAPIVVPVENSVFLRERNSMNPAFAYALGTDKAHYLINIHATFAKPRFHMNRDSLDSYFVGYLLAEHSPLLEILNLFIIDVQATGLMKKWSDDAVRWGILSGLVNVTRTTKANNTPLTLNHFYFAWLALGCGVAVSSLVFVAERRFPRCLE